MSQFLTCGQQKKSPERLSVGRLQFGMVAGFISERWPASNRNPRPDCVGIRISIDQLTAITLLVNEAALNSYKHVFTQGRGTLFRVSLAKQDSGHLHLAIQDDGPGMEVEASERNIRSLGMGIMQAFARQLGGSLEVAQAGGTSLSVEFATSSPEQ